MTNEPERYCVHCGKKIPGDVTFCPYCGTQQPGNAGTADTTKSSENELAPMSSKPDGERPKKPNMKTAFIEGFTDMFSIKKRMSRATFWWLYLDFAIIWIAIGLFQSSIFDKLMYDSNFIWQILLFFISFVYALTGISLFTAEIRRFHDANHSGQFLWFSLIPIVGPILIIIFLAQKTHPAGQRFDNHVNTKPWFKLWWTWTILVVYALLTTIGLSLSAQYISNDPFSQYDLTNTNSSSNGADNTDNSSSSEASSSEDSIELGSSSIDISDKQDFTVDSTQTWAGSTFDIDKVAIYKTDGEYTSGSGHNKEEFNGVVKVHMSIDAGRDISAYPTQATLSTSDGQQVDADLSDSDDFDGDLDSGTQSDGNIYFLLPTLDDISDLSSIRLKWSANYDTDDYDDDNSYKDFDVTIQLNQ